MSILNKLAKSLLVLLAVCSTSYASEQSKPNIIFILADDLGWGDVGYNGSKWIETPNIDQLAQSSRIFDNAYMYPTCSPSRAALITGKQSFKTQVYGVPVLEKGKANKNIFSRGTVQLEHTFYSQPLNDAGYKLAHIGKWHVVGPNPDVEKSYPFKQHLTQPKSGDLSWLAKHKKEYAMYYPEGRGFHKNVAGTWWGDPARGYAEGYSSESGGFKAPFKNPFLKDKKSDEWLTDRLTNEAIEFIESSQDKPFFINLNYYSPHRPSIVRHQAWLKKYQAKAEEELTGKHATKVKELAAYATLVESLDENVGRLVDYLNKAGLSENTVIIFASDNGFNSIQSLDNRFRGYKGTIYEGGIKVPAFVSWPGKIKPGHIATPISVVDYFPSLLELANITDYQGDLDGQSFIPLLFDQPYQATDLFWHINSRYKHEPVSAIRHGEWKMLQFLNSGKVELYNLSTDPKESTNVAAKYPDIYLKLINKLETWRETNKVPLPAASPLNK